MTIKREPGTLPIYRAPTHPGEMLLEEFLKPAGVSQAAAAKRMRIPFQRLNGIVNERRGVSVETALLLEAFTGMPAQFWLTLQSNYDLWHAMRKQNAQGRRPKIKRLETAAAGR